jgi:hypothetical protein
MAIPNIEMLQPWDALPLELERFGICSKTRISQKR